jgi:hypothetical protein
VLQLFQFYAVIDALRYFKYWVTLRVIYRVGSLHDDVRQFATSVLLPDRCHRPYRSVFEERGAFLAGGQWLQLHVDFV